jgi:hypothetical protein
MPFWPLSGIDTARGAIEFVVQSVMRKNGVRSQFRTRNVPERIQAQPKLCSDPLFLCPARDHICAACECSKSPWHLLCQRPTIGQKPRKFFENTRDGCSGDSKMVSARLPKNFRRNRPTVSAGKVVVNVGAVWRAVFTNELLLTEA